MAADCREEPHSVFRNNNLRRNRMQQLCESHVGIKNGMLRILIDMQPKSNSLIFDFRYTPWPGMVLSLFLPFGTTWIPELEVLSGVSG